MVWLLQGNTTGYSESLRGSGSLPLITEQGASPFENGADVKVSAPCTFPTLRIVDRNFNTECMSTAGIARGRAPLPVFSDHR